MCVKVFYSIHERDAADPERCGSCLMGGVADSFLEAFWELHYFLKFYPILGRAEMIVTIKVQDFSW